MSQTLSDLLIDLHTLPEADILRTFDAIAAMPPKVLKAVMAAMDEAMLEKLAEWSITFAEHLNRLDSEVDQQQTSVSGEPDFSLNFFDVMGGTRFRGTRLSPRDLEVAHNEITKAIKVGNFKQGIWVGISLAQKAATLGA